MKKSLMTKFLIAAFMFAGLIYISNGNTVFARDCIGELRTCAASCTQHGDWNCEQRCEQAYMRCPKTEEQTELSSAAEWFGGAVMWILKGFRM